MENSSLTQDSSKLKDSFYRKLAMYWTDFAEINVAYSGHATGSLKKLLNRTNFRPKLISYLLQQFLEKSGTFLAYFETVTVLSALGFQCILYHEIGQVFLLQ